eukprot:COSAG01_NODE_7254_length_3281_cov_2.939032_3_plen_93_part_00
MPQLESIRELSQSSNWQVSNQLAEIGSALLRRWTYRVLVCRSETLANKYELAATLGYRDTGRRDAVCWPRGTRPGEAPAAGCYVRLSRYWPP